MFNWQALIGDIYDVLFIIVGMAIAGAIVVYFGYLASFKHKVRVKDVVNGRKIISDEKAREFKDRDGVVYWQLLRKRQLIPVPPPDCIEIDKRGRKCVEAYKTETGEFVFAKDTASISGVPKEILEIKNKEERAEKIKEWQEENNIINAFQPLTTQQRILYLNQLKKAEAKKTKPWQDYILPVAAIGALVILVVSMMIFYGDMARPLLDMADKQNAYAKIQGEQLKMIKDIKNNVQTLTQETGNYKGEPPN